MGAAAVLLVSTPQPVGAQTALPPDVKPTCTVTSVEFKSWFAAGAVAAGGVVIPADSLNFRPSSECSFYVWSQRMFLWLTSRASSRGFVFESPTFFDVSAPGAGGKRTLVPNDPGRPKMLGITIPEEGPRDMPVAFDRKGKRYRIVQPEVGPTGKALIRDNAGNKFEIERAQVAPDGKVVLLDKLGNAIAPEATWTGKLRLRDASGKALKLRPKVVMLNGRPHFETTDGEAVEVVELGLGQASGGNVLMSRGGSLVYYSMQVNDVFAYFLTRNHDAQTSPIPDQFPTGRQDSNGKKTDLDHVTEFAKQRYGKDLEHANALAMEVKSSWIDAAKVDDPSRYITITASVPVFKQVSDTTWERDGSKTMQMRLALVGMHVVGSVANQPEMIWATFEHVNNAPSERYAYLDTQSRPKEMPRSSAGSWLFFGTGVTENRSRMRIRGRNIVASVNQTIGPVDVVRVNAWGSDAAATDKNTDVIAINNSIGGLLAAGDVRRNYIMTGSTWLNGGREVGTILTANTTMETFQQSTNCFMCHSSGSFNTIDLGVSRIYHSLLPLPPP
jgi:hypothetical protein